MMSLRSARQDDEGLSLVEILVSLTLLATVAAVSATFFVSSLGSTRAQRDRQGAVAVAEQGSEFLRGVPSRLLTSGRSQTAVDAQWATPGTVDLTDDFKVYDAAAATHQLIVPFSSGPTTISGISYSTKYFVDGCFQPAAGKCVRAGAVGAVSIYRLVVAVSWKPTANSTCTGYAGLCEFVVSTLRDPSCDNSFNISGVVPSATPTATPSSSGCPSNVVASAVPAATASPTPSASPLPTLAFSGTPTDGPDQRLRSTGTTSTAITFAASTASKATSVTAKVGSTTYTLTATDSSGTSWSYSLPAGSAAPGTGTLPVAYSATSATSTATGSGSLVLTPLTVPATFTMPHTVCLDGSSKVIKAFNIFVDVIGGAPGDAATFDAAGATGFVMTAVSGAAAGSQRFSYPVSAGQQLPSSVTIAFKLVTSPEAQTYTGSDTFAAKTGTCTQA